MIPPPASSPVPFVRRPPPAGPGDRVGVAALSGPVDPARLESGVAALAGLGFVPVLADNLLERDASGLFAGDDDRRLAAFHRLAADPSLAAIFFARGGWGALRLLPAIDWELLARRPRAYVGYSDLTPFLLQVVARLGFATIHGPMVAADLARGLAPDEERSLLEALAGGEVELPVSVVEPWGLEPQTIEGPFLGGCLSLLTAVLGTPWAVSPAGGLLFVEDVGEPLYRLDRMLTHLHLSGSLTGVRGLIFGHLGGEDITRNSAPDPSAPPSWLGPLGSTLAGRIAPVAWGLAAGHAAPNHALPLGVHARLEPGAGRLVLGIEADRDRPRSTE